MKVVRRHIRRDEFDVQCFRCDYFVSIRDAIFIPSVRNRFLSCVLRHPVRYMCYECIVQIAEFIQK